MSRSPSPPFVIYGAVPWQEPWLVEHNLAHALAQHHRVLYVEPPVTPLTPFRHGSREWRRAALRDLGRRRPRRVGRLHAFRPLALPPLEHSRARAASAPLVRAQVAAAARSLQIRRPVAIAALRSVLELRGVLDERLLVYIVMDWLQAGGELLGRDADEMTGEIEAMCEAADLVCASSRQLCRTLSSRGFESELLRHGFHADLAHLYDDAPPPGDLAGLERPILGYAGTIDARLDFSALAELADRYRSGSLALVGPVSPRLSPELLEPLASRPNVHLLGLKAREELPAYLTGFDCSLMPYREGEWGRHGLPLKLWDYLYAGPPIVGSGYVSLLEYPPPLVHFSRPAGLGDAVAEALDEPADAGGRRRRFALDNSWDRRAERLERLIEERLRATGPAAGAVEAASERLAAPA